MATRLDLRGLGYLATRRPSPRNFDAPPCSSMLLHAPPSLRLCSLVAELVSGEGYASRAALY